MAEKEPTLSFNRETGMYEGMLLVQVDSEIFRRLLIKAVEEDLIADLTDPATWTKAVARVGKITNWLDRPHVKVTPIESRQRPKSFTMVVFPPEAEQPIPKEVESEPAPQGDSFVSLREQLEEKARHLPPYLWWEKAVLTQLPDISVPMSREVKQPLYLARHQERDILAQIRQEWERGMFELDPEAAEQERQHQQEEQGVFMGKLEVVAEAVNGSRIH